jgi:DNA-binding beta-propeller fold protein YncE
MGTTGAIFAIIIALFIFYPHPYNNFRPIANAGLEQEVNSGYIVALDGRESSDKEGPIISYSWKQASGPSVTLKNASGSVASFTAPTVQSDSKLIFSLKVKDQNGNISNPSYVTVSVKAPESSKKIAPNRTVSENAASSDSRNQSLLGSTGYLFVKQWGSQGKGDGKFIRPRGIAVDSLRNVYVADSGNNRIQKFNSTGNFITQWGSQGNASGQFANPTGIAIDSSDNVYVADSGNNRIQKFDNTGKFLLEWGSRGTPHGTLLGQVLGQFANPTGIAVDSSDNVFVVDTGNNRVLMYDSTGKFMVICCALDPRLGIMNSPTGIGVDLLENRYAVDAGNNRVLKFSSSGDYLRSWSNGTGFVRIINPTGIAIDTYGNIYVGDAGNNRVLKFSSNGNFITKLGSQGRGDGQFIRPAGIAVDSSDNVYVTDYSHRVQEFAPKNMTISGKVPPIGNQIMGINMSSPRNPINDVVKKMFGDKLPNNMSSLTSSNSTESGNPVLNALKKMFGNSTS